MLLACKYIITPVALLYRFRILVHKLIRTTVGLEGSDRGLLLVDENGMTTKPGVFAAGDVVTGSKTVVHAVAGAKIATEGMIRYMEQQESCKKDI